MSLRRVFLIVAAAAYAAWTAWLAYEALATADPIILSRPQLFTAPVIVEAQVPAGGPEREVVVTRVYRGQSALGVPEGETQPQGVKLVVTNLGEAHNWRGPGAYFLPLQPDAGGPLRFRIVPVPARVGLSARSAAGRLPPAIYPVTDSTRTQLEEALRASLPVPTGLLP